MSDDYRVQMSLWVPPPEAAEELRDPAVAAVSGKDEMDQTDLIVRAVGAALADLEKAFVNAGWKDTAFKGTVQFVVETAGVKHGYDQVAVIGDECQTVIVDRPDNS